MCGSRAPWLSSALSSKVAVVPPTLRFVLMRRSRVCDRAAIRAHGRIMFLARVVLRPSHYSAVRGRAVHVCDGWWTRYTITCKRFFRPARQPFGDQRHRSQACLGGTAASAWIASGASCVALATLATVDCAGAQDLAGSDDAPAAESVDADGDSEVPDEMPFELPEWFDGASRACPRAWLVVGLNEAVPQLSQNAAIRSDARRVRSSAIHPADVPISRASNATSLC